MKLKVLNQYKSQKAQYRLGQVIEVDDPDGDFLMRDAPGCFEKHVEAPPMDKMVQGPPHAKDWNAISYPELQQELKRRGLSAVGSKTALIKRLRGA